MSKFSTHTGHAARPQKRGPGSRAHGWWLTLALASALMLSACGGGDDDANPSPSAAQSISGTAAAGVPMAGTVTVKDAAGITRTSPIGNNGQYTISVAGLTPPFVFRAEGNVGGNTYVIHSAATSADVGGTINITPLTDLVLANIAGQVAANYFDQGQFSGVSKVELDAEAAKLKEKLLPMLQAIGVDSSIDLLRTPFTPLASALDTALDQLRISTDANSHMATITNVVTQQSIQDDLAVKAAEETAPPQLDDVENLNTASSDIPKIREALLAFSAKFATGLPGTGVLAPYLTDDFLDRDRGKTAFLNELVTFPDLVGAKFTNVVIEAIDYADSTRITAKVGFEVVNAEGRSTDHLTGFRMRKGQDGVWRLHGDQRVLDIDGDVLAFNGLYASGNQAANACRASGFTFWIQDVDDGNNGDVIDYLIVKGPGLPDAGLRFNAPSTGGNWRLPGSQEGGADGGNFHILTGTCQTPLMSNTAIAALPGNATYTLAAYTSDNVKVPLGDDVSGNYQVQLTVGRPLTLPELNAVAFPVFSTPASFTDFTAYTGGDFPLAVSGLNPNGQGWIYLYGQGANGQSDAVEQDVIPDANGGFSTTLTLPLQAVRGKTLRASTKDATGRSLVTAYDYYPPLP